MKFTARLAASLAALLFACLAGRAADEITLTVELGVENGAFSYTRDPGSLSIDQTSKAASLNIQPVGTNSAVALTITADVTVRGWAFFRNTTTNAAFYVDIGTVDASTNFLPLLRLEAEEFGVFRLHPTTAPYVLSSGGTVNLEAWVNGD